MQNSRMTLRGKDDGGMMVRGRKGYMWGGILGSTTVCLGRRIKHRRRCSGIGLKGRVLREVIKVSSRNVFKRG